MGKTNCWVHIKILQINLPAESGITHCNPRTAKQTRFLFKNTWSRWKQLHIIHLQIAHSSLPQPGLAPEQLSAQKRPREEVPDSEPCGGLSKREGPTLNVPVSARVTRPCRVATPRAQFDGKLKGISRQNNIAFCLLKLGNIYLPRTDSGMYKNFQ